MPSKKLYVRFFMASAFSTVHRKQTTLEAEALTPSKTPTKQNLTGSELAVAIAVHRACFSRASFTAVTTYDLITLRGKYKQLEVLDEGTFGLVIKALGRDGEVVIKISKNWDANDYIEDEAKNIWRLSAIVPDKIPKFHDYCIAKFPPPLGKKGSKEHDRALLVTSFEGMNVDKIFRKEKRPVSVEEFVSIAYQLITYVETLAANHTVQGDMGPYNVLLKRSPLKPGSVKVIDCSDVFDEGEEISPKEYFGGYDRTALYSRSPTTLLGIAKHEEMRFAIGTVLFSILTQDSLFRVDSEGSHQVLMTRLLKKVFKILGKPSDSFLKAIPKSILHDLFQVVERSGKRELVYKYSVSDLQTPEGIDYSFIIEEEVAKCSSRIEGLKDPKVAAAVVQLIKELLRYEEPFASSVSLLNCDLFKLFSKVTAAHAAPSQSIEVKLEDLSIGDDVPA